MSEAPRVAVVVSLLNPPDDLPARVARWIAEVGPVVAVDDGSPADRVAPVLRELTGVGAHVLENRRNLGIAHSLNVGIAWVRAHHDPQWILTMDQDSDLDAGYVRAAFEAADTVPEPDRVGLLGAATLNGLPSPTQQGTSGVTELFDPIASGTLTRVEVFDEVGGFDERLFIDSVDSDFNARARRAGWILLRAPGCDLRHALGLSLPIRVLGRPVRVGGRERHVQYHAPFRSYYIARNSVVLARRYGVGQPVWVARKLARTAQTDALQLALGPHRRAHALAIGAGIADGLGGRLGRIGDRLARRISVSSPAPAPVEVAAPTLATEASEPPVVQILVSTWNGREYLAALLDSLLAQQTDAPIRILARDDGSSDGTRELLAAYAADNPCLRIIEGRNLGVIGSFHELLKSADPDARLFMFCDQDDVWLPDKVAAALDCMTAEVEAPEPVLYCARSMVTDEGLEPTGPTVDHDGPSFANALVQNIAPGHTMMFNRPLLEAARDHYAGEAMIMHDHWAYLIGAGLGRVHFDHAWHTLYRSHGDNVIGYNVGPAARAKYRVEALLHHDFGQYVRQARAFEEHFAAGLDDADARRLDGFVHQGGPFARAAYVARYGIRHGTRATALVAELLFVLGRYR